MLIIGCSGARDLAKRAARRLKAKYSELLVERFPDNELRIRFRVNVRNKKIVLFQSFFGNINEKIVETLLAAYTAKELRARKIVLVAPYFPYLREDKRFEKGESVSAKVITKLFSVFGIVFIADPHLHRFKKLNEFFKNAKKITAAKQIADYIEKNIKDPVIIGPDEESFQWAENVARLLGTHATILKKKRISPKKVKIKTKLHEIKDRNVVIVDDIISTGKTMLEVIKEAKPHAKKVYCIAVHGIFAMNSLKKLSKFSKVITCNTIPSRVSKIDALPEIVLALERKI